MYVLSHDIRVFERNVIMAEVPEGSDPRCIELVGNSWGRFSGNTEDSHNRVMKPNEFLQRAVGENFPIFDFLADHPRRLIENTDQIKAQLRKRHMSGNCFAEITGADQNALMPLFQPQYLADLGAKLRHGVTIALLAESAKTVEILAYLRGGQTGFFSQIL